MKGENEGWAEDERRWRGWRKRERMKVEGEDKGRR